MMPLFDERSYFDWWALDPHFRELEAQGYSFSVKKCIGKEDLFYPFDTIEIKRAQEVIRCSGENFYHFLDCVPINRGNKDANSTS